MHDILCKMVGLMNSYFTDNERGVYIPYNNNNESAEQAVCNLLTSHGLVLGATASVEYNTVFSSPGGDCGYLSVAFIEDGKLYHMVFDFT